MLHVRAGLPWFWVAVPSIQELVIARKLGIPLLAVPRVDVCRVLDEDHITGGEAFNLSLSPRIDSRNSLQWDDSLRGMGLKVVRLRGIPGVSADRTLKGTTPGG